MLRNFMAVLHGYLNERLRHMSMVVAAAPVFVLMTCVASVPASALVVSDGRSDLAAAAVDSDPGHGVWAVSMQTNWSRGIQAVGRDEAVRVTNIERHATTWNIEGKTYGQLVRNWIPGVVLAAAGKPHARYAEMDTEERHFSIEGLIATDTGLRPDRVAAWLAASGDVSNSGGHFHAVRDSKDLPKAFGDLFFADGVHQAQIEVFVNNGVVNRYRLWMASGKDLRELDVRVKQSPVSFHVPSRVSFVKLSTVLNALDDAADPRRVISALEPGAQANFEDVEQAATSFAKSRSNSAIPSVVIARTKTGAVLFPDLRDHVASLERARCIDLPAVNPALRRCEEGDRAFLGEKLAGYGEFVRRIAAQKDLTPEQRSTILGSVLHNMFLYSGNHYSAEEMNTWRWFMLDEYVRMFNTEH